MKNIVFGHIYDKSLITIIQDAYTVQITMKSEIVHSLYQIVKSGTPPLPVFKILTI